jgi:lipoate-protein ligase A
VTGGAAVVLGSTQHLDVVDRSKATALGVDVVVRQTGGGTVFLAPGAQVWVDVWVPSGDALWNDDITRASQWLGETWAVALKGLGVHDLAVHSGRVMHSTWSDVVCFAGLGPGEVVVGDAKLVGISQRRTRNGARLHSMAALTWDPAPLLAVLALAPRHVGLAPEELAHVATGLRAVLHAPRDVSDEALTGVVEAAVLASLP